MNSDEKFEQVYSKIVEHNLEELEESRRKARNEKIKNAITVAVVFLIGIVIFFIIYKIFYPNIKLIKLISLLYMILMIIICIKVSSKMKHSDFSQYRTKFKTRVIKEILNSFEENIEYFPEKGISSSIYDEAEFEEYAIYESEDLIQSKLNNNCNFSMSEVLTYVGIQSSRGSTHYEKLFCGILAKIEMPNLFSAKLYLRRDRKDKKLWDRAFRAKLPFDNLRVQLDSEEFEKIFDVYCSDKIVAMRLLTADIMQLLINFQEEMNMEYEITIKNNCMYIRFMSGEIFETAGVMNFSLDKEVLYRYYKILDFVFSLTNKLVNEVKNIQYTI